jgi:drug/metabolite transporter (DMT)-like permease
VSQETRPDTQLLLTLPLVVAGFAVVIWGLTPVATKIAVDVVDPVIVAILRMSLAGAIAWPVILLFRLAPPKTRPLLVLLGISCLTGMILFPLLFTIGQRMTSASHAALILTVQPIFTGLVAASIDRRWPGGGWWIGSAIALSGEIALVSGHASGTGEASLLGDAIVITAGFIASAGYVAGGRLQQQGYPALYATLWSVAIASLVLAPALPFLTSLETLGAVPPVAWLGMAHLALGSTLIAYVAWYWSLGVGGIGRIGLLQFLQTPTGVAAALILLGEPLTLPLIVSGITIIAGVYIAQRR